MRCICCDYSDETPSVFYTGFHEENSGSRRGFDEQEDGSFVCSFCSEASEGLWEEPEEIGDEIALEEDT